MLITVRENATGRVVAEDGYNGAYSSEPEKKIVIREGGDYHINLYGYHAGVHLVLRGGVPEDRAVPCRTFTTRITQPVAQVPEEYSSEEEYWVEVPYFFALKGKKGHSCPQIWIRTDVLLITTKEYHPRDYKHHDESRILHLLFGPLCHAHDEDQDNTLDEQVEEYIVHDGDHHMVYLETSKGEDHVGGRNVDGKEDIDEDDAEEDVVWDLPPEEQSDKVRFRHCDCIHSFTPPAISREVHPADRLIAFEMNNVRTCEIFTSGHSKSAGSPVSLLFNLHGFMP